MGRNAQPKASTSGGKPAPHVDRGSGAALGLRLAIGREGLGIELAVPAALGCIDVVELVVRLPNVRFPFDVTGGVARFRHRRGELERVAIELDARRVARWAEPRLRGLVGTGRPVVSIHPRAFGATVSVLGSEEGLAPPALAFEVSLVATPELAIVVHGARGANLAQPATQLAMKAVAALVGEEARREGARFLITKAAGRIARSLLPDAGVRAPGCEDVVLAGSGESGGVLFVAFSRAPVETAVPRPATLAHEAALLTRAADDARFAGDYARARQLDVATLERAPRHGEVARRIAELDAHVGGRAEAAITTLRSADRLPYQGQLLGDLLIESGDLSGAVAALLREGEREPAPPLAALAFARAATLTSEPADALRWLDAAVARAPSLLELRWERATRRLAQGRLADAKADFQELEAAANGSTDRHRILRRAADVYRERGLGSDAAMLYERALLYLPDDPQAIAGLGIALASEGRGARGATLLARAIELCEAETPPRPTDWAWMQVALARVLAERLGDRPLAVARLRLVPDEASNAVEARGLEGRYRAALGDAAGASLAFARLRERAGRDPAALPWLEEAASFEEARGELALAQALLAMALAIAPSNDGIEARYRSIGARLARPNAARAHTHDSREVRIALLPEPDVRDRTTLAAPPEGAEGDPAPVIVEHLLARGSESRAAESSRETLNAPASGPGGAITPEEEEAKVESLTRTLQGDPTNDAVVDELAERLTRLGRSMELLALLSARLEDAPPERRAELLPRHRAVLERLELEARAAGRDGEADLFRMARDAS